MAQLVTTSRGFSVYLTEDRETSYLSGLLRDGLDQLGTGRLKNKTRLQLLNVIKSLMRGDFPPHHNASVEDWFTLNLKKGNLSDIHFNLLVETLYYIKTGYRRIPLATYRSWLSDVVDSSQLGSARHLATGQADVSISRKDRLEEALSQLVNYEDIFYDWLMKDDGFHDMVYFFFIVTEPLK